MSKNVASCGQAGGHGGPKGAAACERGGPRACPRARGQMARARSARGPSRPPARARAARLRARACAHVYVLRRERRAVDLQIRHVDALARLEAAAHLDGALELVVGDALGHAQLHRAVVQLHRHAHRQPLHHRVLLLGAREHDAPVLTRLVIAVHQRERDGGAGLERHGLGSDGGAAEFRALEIAEQLDGLPQLRRDRADHRHERLKLSALPV